MKRYTLAIFILLVLTLIAGNACVPEIEFPDLPDITISTSPDEPSDTKSNPQTEPVSEPFMYALPDEYQNILSQPEWAQTPGLQEGFFTGNTFMDWYSDITYERYLQSTLDSMQQSGGEWVIYDNYWSYYTIEPPVFGPFTDQQYGTFRDASGEEIAAMIQQTHFRSMKFALMVEVNWDVMRGEWQGWDYQQTFWEKSASLLAAKANELVNPTEETNQFWDDWFDSYGSFVLNQAQIAQDCGADMLIIGKQIDGAVSPGNEQRWRDLIARVKAVYDGLLSYASWTNQDYTQAEFMPYEEMDYIIIYYYNEISTAENPSIAELKESFETFNRNKFQPLSEKYDKPVIFLTPFQSRDYGSKQEWFEPSAPSPDVREDLLIQAKMYEALFQAVQDEDWVQGVWTWGYWWRDDFTTMYRSDDSSFNKSSSIRNKPAMKIFEKWSP